MPKKVKAKNNKAKNVETKPVKLKLAVRDRVVYAALLPKQSDILSLTLAQDIGKKIQLSQAEMKKIGMKVKGEGGGVTWEKETISNIEFTNAEITFLRTQVDKLDKEKKVTPDILSLCLKIRQQEGT